MPTNLQISQLHTALDQMNLPAVKQLIDSKSISIDEINELNHTVDSVLHRLLRVAISNGGNPASKEKCLNIIKFLIESGVQYDVVPVDDSRSPLLFAIANERCPANISVYLLKQHLQEVGGDFEKLKSSNQNIFSEIAATGINSDLFQGIVREFPELLKPFAIDRIFFLESEEKSSRSISDAASFDPVQALDGKGLQVSISPGSVSKKKTIVIDYSFLNDKERQIKQIRRLIAEGFSVLVFNGSNNFIKLEHGFTEDVFKQAAGFPFSLDPKKYYKILDLNFTLPNDEVLLLDGSRSKELETLFYSPIYVDGPAFPANNILPACLLGRYDDIEKLQKDDLSYLMRVGITKDLSNEEIIRLLEKEPKIKEIDVLEIAISNNQKNVLDLLIINNFNFASLDPDKKIRFFAMAVRYGHTAIVKTLLEKGAEVNCAMPDRSTVLMMAALCGHTETVKALLEKGAAVNHFLTSNFKGFTALASAAQNGHIETVEALLEKGAEVNRANSYGFTALTIAAQNGHTAIVKALLENRAEVNHANFKGFTALMIATQDGHIETVEALLEKGAEVNHANSNGSTALTIAAQNGHTAIVKALLENRAKVNHSNSNGSTALTIAAQNGHTAIVKALIKVGADVRKVKKMMINTGVISNSFLGNSSLEAIFTMAPAGEIMNLEHLTIALPYPARTRVEVQGISGYAFIKRKPDKAKNNSLSAAEITDLQNDFTAQQREFETSTTKAYFSFLNLVEQNKTTQLLSTNYPAKIVGIKVDNGAKITKLFQDEFGFYHIKTDKPCRADYVLEVDHTTLPKLNLTDTALGRIVDQYKVKIANSVDQKVPKQQIFQSNSNYLKQIFETGAPASCAVRTATFMHKIKKDHPELLDECRVVNIDRNHAAIEVKTGDGANDFVYIDLGGTHATLREVSENYSEHTNIFSRFTQGVVNLADRAPSLGAIGRVVALPFVAAAYPFVVLGRGVAAILRRRSNKVSDVQEETGAPPPETLHFPQYQQQPTTNTGPTLTASHPPKTQHPFQHFVQTQRSQQLSKIEDKDTQKLFLQKHPSLIFANKGEENFCANRLIESARKENPKRPIFYIDSPKQIDVLKKAIKIIGEDGYQMAADISAEGFLADFLQEANLYNRRFDSEEIMLAPKQDEQDQLPLLIINWSNFTPRQRTSFNTIIDDQRPSVDGKDLVEIKIVSICDQKIDDESFVSRHANKYQASFARKTKTTADDLQDAINIDLKGASDWKQQLFGRIFLQDKQIIWTKSDFVRDLESGKTNFSVSNCSDNAEFKKLLEQAQAFGSFVYNGYKIPLTDNLKIKPATKNFDFSKYDPAKITLVKNQPINQVAAECKIINTQIFDFLLRRKEISLEGEYSEKPGFIELASERPDKTLKLFISSNLTQAQFYSLFCEATKAEVKLELSFAPGVATPDYLSRFVAPKQQIDEPKKNVRAHIYTAQHPRSIKLEPDAGVIDIEDCTFQDLVSKISYKINGRNFSFEENKSNFIEYLKQGTAVVLRGEFSEDLLQMLQPYLTEEYAANLTLIVENKDNKAQKLLEFLGEGGYIKLAEDIENIAAKSEISEEDSAPSYTVFVNAPDAELMRDASIFKYERKTYFKYLLKHNSVIALCGDAGVGKTFLVHEEKNIHKGFENFDNWIRQGGILFLDESNIIDTHLTIFEPLKEGGNKRIFYQGKFYQLDKKHKVVLAYNPPEYGGGRVEQKLLLEGGVSTFAMQQLPASYIYFLLKTEIFEKTEFQNNKDIEARFLNFCKAEIVKYQDLIDANSKEKITIRALQESALQFLTKVMDGKDSGEEAAAYAKNIKTKNFVSTDATIALENALGKCLAVRKKQREGNLPVCGTNGVLFEGASGVGKSALIKAYLDAEGCKYHKIDSSMPYESQKQQLIRAYKEGAILWIDEIDTCINNGIERLLTSALSGLDPEGSNQVSRTGSDSDLSSQKTVTNAGFMLVASSNGITQTGRAVVGPAIRSRLDCPRPSDLQEYKENDIKKIISTWIVGDQKGAVLSEQGQTEVSDLAKEYLELQQSGGENAVNLRMLRRFVDEQKEMFKVVEKDGGGSPSVRDVSRPRLIQVATAPSTDTGEKRQ